MKLFKWYSNTLKTQLYEFEEFHIDLVEILGLDLHLTQEQHETLRSAISTIRYNLQMPEYTPKANWTKSFFWQMILSMYYQESININ